MVEAEKTYRVAIVGATGLVGGQVVQQLTERQFPVGEIVTFSRSIPSHTKLSVRTVEGFDLAFMCTDAATSQEWAPQFAAGGAAVIDKTSAWRRTKPLVVPEVNPEALDDFEDIIASPNCSTIQAVVPLKPIVDAVGLSRLKIHTAQAVSGAGIGKLLELRTQAQGIVSQSPRQVIPDVNSGEIAFNVQPQVGEVVEGCDLFDEEEKIIHETRQILGLKFRRLGAACTRVSVFNGHSQRIEFTPIKQLSVESCQGLLREAPGVELVLPYPTAAGASGQDKVQVGLIRRDITQRNGWEMWVAADNLRKGAATNALQIAELMIEKGII